MCLFLTRSLPVTMGDEQETIATIKANLAATNPTTAPVNPRFPNQNQVCGRATTARRRAQRLAIEAVLACPALPSPNRKTPAQPALPERHYIRRDWSEKSSFTCRRCRDSAQESGT